jgi:hypothetical protein
MDASKDIKMGGVKKGKEVRAASSRKEHKGVLIGVQQKQVFLI